jgi:hypothetical protein
MSIEDVLNNLDGTGFWKIAVATHLGTSIDNETTVSVLQVSLRRQQVEATYRTQYACVKEPVYGYNCFGHVLASRRTAIPKPNIELIFSEDGTAQIPDREARIGDIVIYSDDEGPTHAARVTGFRIEDGVRVPVVLSKFDDSSGEYEHRLSDVQWAAHPLDISWRCYRERHRAPARWLTWELRLQRP